ncbi:DUF3000 family protein [Bifidobacterium cebidarum]|uniref:Pyruvate formate-lyase 1 activating enzyme n=1 Tax=Bifidobacterium cebidarum TaxID=2650773 RepID=A0A6I1GKR7_9BIFI|nr:DUF3000 family protein [Bifidobacterium cebidarum]KAB7788538.1 pyruvate formate-lyase 1 activating enzyme [Bifidobacterium cebidarum]
MASIYAFPAGVPNEGQPIRPHGVPDDLWAAVESVSTMPLLAGVHYREIPVPSTLADFGIGVELESAEHTHGDAPCKPTDGLSHTATGWIMVLYCERPRMEWGSRWRCTAFARLPLSDTENDPLTPSMYWDDMCDHLEAIEPDSLSGTVTVNQNTSFGAIGGNTSAGCEIRASWTPLDGSGPNGTMDAGAQVNSWATFLTSTVRCEEDDDR